MIKKLYSIFILITIILMLIALSMNTFELGNKDLKIKELEYEVLNLKSDIKTLKFKNDFLETKVNLLQTRIEDKESEEPEEPKTQRELIDLYVADICEQYDFDPLIIHSVIWHESRYKPEAKNTTHLGLMQVSTRWHMGRAERLGVEDFYDPYGNILLGVDYLSEIANRYDDMRLVLMTYNMGDKRAKELFNNNEISWYATSVLERAEELKTGGD